MVEIGMYGAGLLFATGQLSAGLIAFGQLALGPIFFAGLLAIRQGKATGEARDFLEQLSAELNRVLAFR